MISSSSNLSGKVVLVTGGGAGIGRAVSTGCAEAGAAVIVASPGRNGEETAQRILQRGGRAHWQQTDVTVAAEVEDAVKAAVDLFGGLDCVVHNATSRHSSEVTELSDLDDTLWNDHVAVSVTGAFNCASAARNELTVRKGRLIVMTSPAAMEGSATLPAYAAMKGALRGFAKALAIEWGPLGITVAPVSPLAVTPALANAYRENPDLESRLEGLVPLGRIGDPELDIAPVVAFLIGDGARYLSGQTIGIDGGRFTTL